MIRSGPSGTAGVVLAATGTGVLGALVLTERFEVLPAALAAYGAAGWVLGLESTSTTSTEEDR